MIERLELTKTLSRVDDAALYQYCQLFAGTEAIEVTRLKTESSIDLLESNLQQLPKEDLAGAYLAIAKLRTLEARYITQIRQGRMALRTYLVEFGLTPAARSRVTVTGSGSNETQQPKSPLAAILAQSRTIRRIK